MDNKLRLTAKYFSDIEDAVDYDSATSHGFARRQLKLVLNAFLEGKIVVVEDLELELKSIEEYKEWKKDRVKLNRFNSDILIKEIELSKSRNQKW